MDEQLKALRDRSDPRFKHLIGTKVEFVHKGQRIMGTLEFAGINDYLHNQFQATVNRTPYWPVNPNSIKPYVDKTIRVIEKK